VKSRSADQNSGRELQSGSVHVPAERLRHCFQECLCVVRFNQKCFDAESIEIGADVAIEALGMQGTFENALRCLRPGGTLSSLGVYSGKLQVPYDAFAAGLGDYRITTTLCPGGKERMRRLMEVVKGGRVDFTPLLTHTFSLDEIKEGYRVFGERIDGALKVAIKPL
jgi:threonine dehydrogenase-like Zn-dependent dehydrogenase